MNKNVMFGEGPIFTISNYFFWFLLGNLYFWIMNIPYIFVSLVMSLSGKVEINVILILSLLPMGPALAALFSIMGKLIREKEISITKDFFKAYRTNFFDSLFFWTLEIVILTIIKLDMIIVSTNAHLYFFNIILKIVSVICLALLVYIFPIITRFHLSKRDIMKLAFEYLIKKIYIFIIVFAIVYLLWTISNNIFQSVASLFSISIITYIIMYLEKNSIEEIEHKLSIDKQAKSLK